MEKDFIGSDDLSTTLFPLKGEVSNHKGIFDEVERGTFHGTFHAVPFGQRNGADGHVIEPAPEKAADFHLIFRDEVREVCHG